MVATELSSTLVKELRLESYGNILNKTPFLSNNFSYTGVILSEDQFFITIKDRFGGVVSIGKKDTT